MKRCLPSDVSYNNITRVPRGVFSKSVLSGVSRFDNMYGVLFCFVLFCFAFTTTGVLIFFFDKNNDGKPFRVPQDN